MTHDERIEAMARKKRNERETKTLPQKAGSHIGVANQNRDVDRYA
jgi:hypothetical protein